MEQLSRVEIGRMRELADFLDAVPPEDFDLSLWVERQQRAPTAAFFGLIERDPGCGFAGCAMGWAAHSNLFPGLRLLRDASDITYRGFRGYEAAEALFGITPNQSIFFFSKKSYENHADPGHVAARLRRFADIVERRLARRGVPALRLVG